MKNLFRILLTSGLAATSLPALSADFDGSQPLLCATQYVSQCDAGMDCVNVFPASVNVPDFFQVNVQDKVIGAINDERTTPIERVEQLDGKLVLQGADDGVEDVRDGMAWSMSIDVETGKLVLSAAGDGFAMVIFGACAPR
jgi:hypothetical protein